MTDTIEQRVARGVAFLNKAAPGWRDQVRPDGLSLLSNRMCVLGQAFGSFSDGVLAMQAAREGTLESCGFNPEIGHRELSDPEIHFERLALEDQWRRVIHTPRVPVAA